VSTRPSSLERVLAGAYADAGLVVPNLPDGVEVVRRGEHLIAINHTDADVTLGGSAVPAREVRVLRAQRPQ
jgi:hypothetical protein